MPSWKKVLISGSDAALNTLIVTNGITGSLFGTASWAVSASWAPAPTNAFIQNGNSFGTTALLGTNDNQSLALETNGTTNMFISSSGNVGIGKITPNAKLDVNGNTTVTGSLRVAGTIRTTQDILVNGIDVGRGNSTTSVLVGAGALQNNTGGNSNVAIGSQALFTSSNASGLVAIGANTLRLNTVGSANTAVGTNTLQANTTGNNNTAIGREALVSSSVGFNNTANGRSALFQNITGNNNSAIGAFALANNLLGSGNIAIGVSASLSTTGNSNIVIGFSADTLAAANNNSIVIGSGSVGLGSNTTVIGNLSTTATAIYGDLLVGQTTDNGIDKLQVTGTSNLNGNTRITGSLRVTAGITGSLFGTASWAISASWAPTPDTAATASFVTASNVYGPYGSNSIISASYAASSTSASYALTASYSQNLQISGSIANVDYIDFNTGSAIPAWQSGRVFWDNTDGALSVYNAEADITLQVGQESWVRVFNQTGAPILNGTAVRIVGAQGDIPKIVKAQSVQVSGSALGDNQIIGIATHDIETNSIGYVTTQGLTRGLNTNAFTDGDLLFVSSSAGVLTNVIPQAPYEVIQVGICVKAGPGGSGIVFVFPTQPIDFGDLASAERGTYQYGDIWSYQQTGSVGVWKHGRSLSGSYGITGSLNVTQGITGSLFGTSSYALTSSFLNGGTNAFIQGGNSFGTTALLGTNDNQSLAIETSGSERMRITSAGNVGIGTTAPTSKLTVQGTTAMDTISTGSELTTTATGTNWSGSSFVTGYTHTTGSITALTSTFTPTLNSFYYAVITVTNRTSGSVTTNFGESYDYSRITGTRAVYSRADTTTFTCTPTTDFDGTIAISIKATGVLSSITDLKNSAGTTVYETRIGAGNTNTHIGINSGTRTANPNNTGFGYSTLQSNTGAQNTAIGALSLYTVGGASYNTAVGYNVFGQSKLVTANTYNVGLGGNIAGANTTSGYGNILIGWTVAQSLSSGGQNVGLGYTAFTSLTTGAGNIAMGASAGNTLATGTFSVFLGHGAGALSSGNTNEIVIGASTTGLGSNSIVLGNDSITKTALKGSVLVGTTTDIPSSKLTVESTTQGFLPPRTNLTSNITAPAQGLITYVTGSTNEGLYYYNSGSQIGWHKLLTNTGSQAITGSLTVTQGITGSLFGTSSWAISASWAPASAAFPYTGSALITGSLGVTGSFSTTRDILVNGITAGRGGGNISGNTVLGLNAAGKNITGADNVVIGFNAFSSSTLSSNNTVIGKQAMELSTSPYGSVAIGLNAMRNGSFGGNDVAIGNEALMNYSNASLNVALGNSALRDMTANGNTAVGADAGRYISNGGNNTGGNNSVYLGYNTRPSGNSETNEIVIGQNAIGLGNNTTTIGNSSTLSTALYGDLLLGQTIDNGTDKLQVTGTSNLNGNTRITGSLRVTAGITGSLFGTSSWAVSASWAPATTNTFVQGGNSFGTTALLGTNDNQALALETNGTTKMFISSSGNVGIGTTTPAYKLSVNASSNSDGIQVIQSGTSRIELKGDGTAVWGSAADFGRLTYDTGKAILQAQSGKALSLGANNLSDHLYINTSGNVGIGTTVLTAKLHILENNTSNSSGIIIEQSGTGDAILQYLITGVRRWVTGIDSSDANKFKIVSSANLDTDARLTIDTLGNVGIGTIAPNAKLDVSGSAIITGSLIVTNGITGSLFGTASVVSSIANNITDNTDNYLLTATGGTGINGESSLTFDGTKLTVDGSTVSGDVQNLTATYTITDGVSSIIGGLANWDVYYATGEILMEQISSEAFLAGQLVAMNPARKWKLADATVADEKSTTLLGITLTSTSGADESVNILLRGFVSKADVNNPSSVTEGAPLYITTTPGRMSETAPSTTGQVVRAVGHTFWNETSQVNSTVIIRFNPDNTYMEI